MGLFNTFRKKPSTRYIELQDVDSWLDGYISRNEIGTRTGIIKREIISKSTKLKELLESFKLALPKNTTGLPERSISAIKINKDKYISYIESFLNKTILPERLDEIKEFIELLSETMTSLEEEIQKHYFSIKEHYPEDIEIISKKLKELDAVISSGVSSFENSPIEKIALVKELVKNYYVSEEEIKFLRAELEALDSKRLIEVEKRSKIEDKVNIIKNSLGYQDFRKTQERLEELVELEERIVSEFKSDLASLDTFFLRILGKAESTLNSFSKKPLETMLKNGEKLAKKIDSSFVKAKKNKVFIDDLNISSKKIRDYQKTLSDFVDERKGLNIRLKNNSANLNVREHEGWINSINDSINVIEKKMEKVELVLERLSLNLAKQKIRKVLKELDSSVELR
ncbi:hypothetical protein COV13_04055 [Candidatus Woesearchaeota archaeon CG10_big_fil_rev_8_21_14_0_10_32_9]|nr:MAG: hypothetical protein COV13_04055 [Candidatus Woesearchaeota archaeon CG10_big_fil_rev_8_21_14_0_10_32_9]